MSLSSALNSALVGLDVSSRRAEVVSENVANAGRAGFGRRSLSIAPISSQLSGLTTTIQRNENSVAIALRREAQGQSELSRDPAQFWASATNAVGIPGEAGSLASRLADLEASLIDATTRPASTEALRAVSVSLSAVTDGINLASDRVQQSRQDAEDAIVRTVEALNLDLAAVETLNTQIQKLGAAGSETVRLEDQRALALDRISAAVAIDVLPRSFGSIAIISKSGQILLDGNAREVGFAPSVQVTPDRILGAGLNGLTVGGQPVGTGASSGSIGGGRLEGLFLTRDTEAPAAQERLDALASELITRFSGPESDPTLAAGEAGLFVDDGGGAGVASRLAVSGLVSVSGAAEFWRIRDGLNAAAPNPASPSGNLGLSMERLSSSLVPIEPSLGTSSRSITALVLDTISSFSALNSARSGDVERADALILSANDGLASSAVDVDEEMRRLIEIEQSYAAAARVVEVVGDMMDRLSRI